MKPPTSVFTAPREGGRTASAGGQQDRVRPAGLRAGPEAGLRCRAQPDAGGEAVQSVHVQLCAQVHEHSHQAAGRELPHVQQGRV